LSTWDLKIDPTEFDTNEKQQSLVKKLVEKSKTIEHALKLHELLFEWSDLVSDQDKSAWIPIWKVCLSWLIEMNFTEMFWSTFILLKTFEIIDQEVLKVSHFRWNRSL
jgi:hypothetical protein